VVAIEGIVPSVLCGSSVSAESAPDLSDSMSEVELAISGVSKDTPISSRISSSSSKEPTVERVLLSEPGLPCL